MRLLFVHDHFFYKGDDGLFYSAGGFPHYLWEKYLNHFNDIWVIGRYGGEIVDKSKYVKSSRSNVNFIFVDKISSFKGIFNILKVKRRISELLIYSDAVVVRLPSENGLLAASLAEHYNKPYSIEVVGCAWDSLWNYGGAISKIYAPVLFSRMRIAIQKAPQVLYVTSEFLQRRYPANSSALTVSASNVDISQSDIKLYNTNRSESLSSSNSKIVFGIVGNFKTKYKGLHIAISALGKLKRERVISNFELRILGKGNPSLYNDLVVQNNLEEQIIFCGTLPNGSPVLNWLDNVDIYLQPSLTEGLPRSVIEAMSRGCICLGSNVGGIPELLGAEFVCQPGSTSGLANLIRSVLKLSNPEVSNIIHSNLIKAEDYTSDKLNVKRNLFYKYLKCKVKS